MPWTNDQKLAYLLRLPWTLTVENGDEPGEYLIRVQEIPSAVGHGTRETVEEDLWEALRTALAARLHFGDPIPLPPSVDRLPWESHTRPERAENRQVFRVIQQDNSPAQVQPVPGTGTETEQFVAQEPVHA